MSTAKGYKPFLVDYWDGLEGDVYHTSQRPSEGVIKSVYTLATVDKTV